MWEIQDPILVFSVLMLIFLIAPFVAEKLKLPELVLMLIAGVLLGPNGLGLMKRAGGIELFGSIGLLYIMFVAGLETDAQHFKKTAKRSAVFGLVSFLIPQLLGTLVGYYVLGFGWMTSILLASMFASHTLIAYPIASKFGIAKSEPVVIAVGGTVLTNTLSLLVLAVVADYSKGEALGMGFWLTLVLGIVILTWAIWYWLPRLANWFFRHVPEKGGAQFVFVLGMVCLCSYWSHYAKMEPIIGAFLAGVAFNRLIPAQSTLMNRLIFVGNTFFIPFFLISVGMLINPGALFTSVSGATVALVMSLTVIVTKYWSADITRRVFGYNRSERNVIFGLSVAQAAATLAAVLVGYELKIFNDDVLNGTIVMILVSCSLGCYEVEKFGRDLAVDSPVTWDEERTSEQRIMVAVSNPDNASKLLDLTFLLRNAERNDEIFPVTVVSEMGSTSSSVAAVARAEKLMAECMSQAASLEVPLMPGIRLDANPSDGLIRAAKETRSGLLLIGWSGKNAIENTLFGSIPDSLRQDCPARLLFCHLTAPVNTCGRVVMPLPELGYRRSDLAQLVADAKHLAGQIGATLYIYLPKGFPAQTVKMIENTKPQCSMAVSMVESWRTLENEVLHFLHPLDMLIFPLERRGSALWRPRFERLAEVASSKHCELNIMIAYPPLPAQQEEDEFLMVPTPPDTDFNKLEIRGFDLDDDSVAGMIRMMAGRSFEERPVLGQEITRGLLDSLNSYPFELSSGAVLLHTRSGRLGGGMIMVGRSSRAYRFRHLGGQYNVIIALVSPEKSAGQELHLNALAGLARRFSDRDFAAAVARAGSAADIAAMLQRPLAGDPDAGGNPLFSGVEA